MRTCASTTVVKMSPRLQSGVAAMGGRSKTVVFVLTVLAILVAAGSSRAASLPGSTPAALYWSYPSVIDTSTINALSCPSTSFCAGVDFRGDVVTSTDPTGGAGAWTVASIDAGTQYPDLSDVSCPEPAGSLCVAVGESGIFTSSAPTGGVRAWTALTEGGLGHRVVSCASRSLCVVADGGEVIVSTDPTGGAGAWTAMRVDGSRAIGGLSCPSITLCVGVDEAGDVVASADPAGGAGAWTVTHVSGDALYSVSCPSTSFCLVDSGHDTMTSTDPVGGVGAWEVHEHVIPGEYSVNRLACSSSSLCVASESNGGIASSSDPGSDETWESTEGVDGTYGIGGVACPSDSLCFATDEALLIGVPAHTLDVTLTGAGFGVVGSTPIACPYGCTYAGPACPRNCDTPSAAFIPQRLNAISCNKNGWFSDAVWGTCSLAFPAENTVRVTPTPAAGSVFVGWSGACSGTGTCDLAMGVDQAVTAIFSLAPAASPAAATTHGTPKPKCVVPSLRGDSLAKARRLLRRAHCRLGKALRPAKRRRRHRRRHSALVVVGQRPHPRSKLAFGGRVAVALGVIRPRTGRARLRLG